MTTALSANPTKADLIREYISNGRVPWSRGYSVYKSHFVVATLQDQGHMDLFARGLPLPEGFGVGIDERAVEYPWTFSRLPPQAKRILDAGSTFNKPWLLDLPALRDRAILIHTLEIDWITLRPNVSYLLGDFLEDLPREGLFDSIVSISTLEHVGMRPPQGATAAEAPKDPTAYRAVLANFRRWLAPGGQLLLTLPFGRAADHDWLQVFDLAGVHDVIAAFGGDVRAVDYFRYLPGGWQRAKAEDCAGDEYYDMHTGRPPPPDGAAAARAVVCLDLVRA